MKNLKIAKVAKIACLCVAPTIGRQAQTGHRQHMQTAYRAIVIEIR